MHDRIWVVTIYDGETPAKEATWLFYNYAEARTKIWTLIEDLFEGCSFISLDISEGDNPAHMCVTGSIGTATARDGGFTIELFHNDLTNPNKEVNE